MKSKIKDLFNIHVWRDFYDEQWRIKVTFWKWEVLRVKVDYEETQTFSGKTIKPVLTKLQD